MSALTEFVASIPDGWATAPIYVKGATLPKGGEACGKSPLGRASYEDLSAAATALYIEREPEVFQAVGVYAGPRSNGLVIFDVDANLGAIEKKWGADLANAPKITSPKKNAAKFLFRIPEEYWGEVQGMSLAASQEGWEVLWGRQGVLCGAYPKGGKYSFKGDLNAIPDAPGWLLARMQDSFRSKHEKADKKALKDSRWSMRSREEKIAVAQSCLSVIPPQGRGSEDFWWRIGAMLNSELPGEDGLNLWREWSLQDAEYEDDWAAGHDPCGHRWEAGFKTGGGLGFGSLVHQADHYDPERARFQKDGCLSVIQTTEAAIQQVQQVVMSFEDAMKRVEEAMDLADPGKRNYELNQIAAASGYRDQAKLEQIYVDHVGFKSSPGELTLDRILDYSVPREYLVPDVLPSPAVVLMHGAGGDGKSMAAWTLAKHVVEGLPFVVRGKLMPVKQGGVVILNGDQPISDMCEQLQEADYPLDSRTLLRPDWSLQYYAQFVDLMKKRQPALVVIDSLIGCSGGKAFDENKSDFAMPLYWLTRNNGILFPATTILIIHHDNKSGSFRGTSAIRDAVTETWGLKKPDGGIDSLPANCRTITIEKSRCGRGGTQLIMTQEKDLSFSVRDYTPEIDNNNTSPSGITDRVLQRIRTGAPRWFSRADLNADPVVGGSVAAITKSLQRLVKRGLLRTDELPPAKRGGKPVLTYQAVLSSLPSHTRGEVAESVQLEQNSSAATDEQLDTRSEKEEVSNCSEGVLDLLRGNRTHSEKSEQCPVAKPSEEAENTPIGHPGTYPPAQAHEDGRTDEETKALWDNAYAQWN